MGFSNGSLDCSSSVCSVGVCASRRHCLTWIQCSCKKLIISSCPVRPLESRYVEEHSFQRFCLSSLSPHSVGWFPSFAFVHPLLCEVPISLVQNILPPKGLSSKLGRCGMVQCSSQTLTSSCLLASESVGAPFVVLRDTSSIALGRIALLRLLNNIFVSTSDTLLVEISMRSIMHPSHGDCNCVQCSSKTLTSSCVAKRLTVMKTRMPTSR